VVVAVVGGVTAWAITSGGSPRASTGATHTAAPPTPTASSGRGTPAPPFTLSTLSGGRVSLAQLAGHPVLVNFWASWCHPCRQEFPLFGAAQARHRAQGLTIVGISYQDIPDDARRFVREEHASWTFARDDDGAVAAAYGVRPVPETFFIRPDGTLAGRVLGITSTRQLEASLRQILPRA